MGVENLREQKEAQVVREEEPDYDVDIISIHVPDVMNDMIQPLILQTIHTTPPDKDYVAPDTKSILEEFKEEILNITMDDEEADFNPTRDIEELERLLAKYIQSHSTEKEDT
nr:hypothetical protein [Tanacetum cinerariifolium]